MGHEAIIKKLEGNKAVFQSLLKGVSSNENLFRPKPEKWCLLEIVCHLYDEEREDFRARVKLTLENPEQPLQPIDPVGWVSQRNYIDNDYSQKLNDFLQEREQSVQWLKALKHPDWGSAINHPKLGKMTAQLFLANWLAHDYLHFRQITMNKYYYLTQVSHIIFSGKLGVSGELILL